MHDLDHLVIAVTQLDSAASAFSDAGYVVTPTADHPFGTSNRLVVFDSTYIELVAVTRPELLPENGFAAAVAGRLRQDRPGLTHVVLATRDPEEATRQYPASEMFDFSRPAPAVDGTTRTASFTLVMLPATDPGFFFCFHHEPAAVWDRTHLNHPNGARRILAVETEQRMPKGSLMADAIPVAFGAIAETIATDGSHPRFEVAGIEFSGRSAGS